MPPRLPAKARDFDYSNVGKAGRRTGITLKEGKRDEHGMEEIDGMFSSPEKSPAKTNGAGFANDTIVNSEDMETGDSSIPEPADLLSGRRGNRTSFLLPPRSRSPRKSFMAGSPRRTPGIRSSPVPNDQQSSSPTASRGLATRAIDFARVQPKRSPLAAAPSSSASPSAQRSTAPSARGQAWEPTADETADFSDDGNHLMNGDEEDAEDTHFAESYGDYHESFEAPGHGEEQEDHAGEEDEVEAEDPPDEDSPVAAKSAGRGRKRKDPPTDADTGSARAATNTTSDAPKRRGRKPKNQAAEAQPQQTGADDDPRPTKKTKTAASKQASNLQMSEEQENELNKVVENINNRNGPLKNRSLYILRRETPSDSTATHTRSGRVSVRPLAYWRNERCVFGDGGAEIGQRFPVSTIKEIIRTEEEDTRTTRPSKKSSKKRKKGKQKKDSDEPSEDEAEDHKEPWENDPGVFYGPIKKWDPAIQKASLEEEMLDIAYAPSAVQTHEVRDATFRFAKILSTPFIGSGFVDMPPGSVKRQKNSKRMHMVFFVYHGRIQVDVSGLQFSAGKGTVFQVPRGNMYSFANDLDKPAAIFFTQGCVPLEPEEGAGPSSGPAAEESQVQEPAEEPAPKKKGRPKLKK